MTDETDQPFDRTEEIRADNELLKLKLELDHGMKMCEIGEMSADQENQWLRYIYDFENLHKHAKQVRIYDFIDRPLYDRIESLSAFEIPAALDRLMTLLNEREVYLDCLCEYEPAIIYKFITEEFFDLEMDDISMKGMMHRFTYEEFHPNHDYALREKASDVIKALLERKWNDVYDRWILADQVTLRGTNYPAAEMAPIIRAFQEAHSTFSNIHFEPGEVAFDLETNQGTLSGKLAFTAKLSDGTSQTCSGACEFHFILNCDVWGISYLRLPYFG